MANSKRNRQDREKKSPQPPSPAQPAQKQDIIELFTKADMLAQEGDLAKVQALYTDWLALNPGHPFAHAALFNLGCSQLNTAPEAAERTLREVLRRQPEFLQGHYNLGVVLERLGRDEETLDCWARLTALPDTVAGQERELLLMALNQSGRLLERLKRLHQAELALERSLRLDPAQPKVIHHWVHLRQKQCAWPVFAPLPGLTPADMRNATSALAMLDVTDDPAVQLEAAQRFASEHIGPGEPEPLASPAGYGHTRLRVGYLSSDLCLHPVSMLMVELFERHDRNRVEVYGYCWSREDGSALRRRVLAALDHHVPIGQLTDEEAARRIRQDEIDVLVDLHGPTAGARPNILARRPATVQVSYLGFPGTSGMACIDHVLCDRYVLPEATLPCMTEKPLYLPEVFQVCDTRRQSSPAPTRAQCGLPQEAMVYCAFNNSHKITPEMFDAWLGILARVPGSVLWLVGNDPAMRENLTRACTERGLPAERLIFAPRALPPDYLARYAAADLFLDCFPFNGGTTANDALFMGLPVLTLSGRSFASRMAGSLLSHLGLPELISQTMAQYEETAVALGLDRERLAELKARLAQTRRNAAVFDTARQAANIEMLLQAAHQEATARAGALPKPPREPESRPAVRLFHIAYSEETLRNTPSGFGVLNNIDSARNDWREYWPIRNFLLRQDLDEETFYGFLSPRFQEKTGLGEQQVRGFIQADAGQADVYTFSPQPDMGAFFLNIFEQGEVFHPGILEAGTEFLRAAGLEVNLETMVMDSRQIVFSNYFVARPRFWREWLALGERLFALCEGPDTPLRRLLTRETTYPGGVQMKVFVSERIASLLLTIHPSWRVKAYNTFACAWSGTPLNQFRLEAVMSDALKIAMREHGFKDYIDAYSAIRDRIRG